MSGRLPREVDPIRLADEGARLKGELPGCSMARLRAAWPDSQTADVVSVDLVFERTAHGERLLRGTVETRVEAVCERCLERVQVVITAKPYVLLLQAQEAQTGLAEDTETLVVEGPVDLSELAEDELLLAMPMFAMHGEGECAAPGATPMAPKVGGNKPNPFAALRDLKGKNR